MIRQSFKFEESNIVMKKKKKGNSAFLWMVSTVLAGVVPFLLTYLFRCYTNRKLLDFEQYTNDILLTICSIACGLMFLAFDSSKKISDRMRKGSKVYACLVALTSGGFYFFVVGSGRTIEDNYIFVIGILLAIGCIIIGIKLENSHDVNKRKLEEERVNLCWKFFKETIPSEYKNAFKGFKKTGFCEMQEVNPIERLKAEKSK